MSNKKSRPERPYFGLVDTNVHETPNKAKKRSANATVAKTGKYVPGEFILDTKGRIALVKYVGECHKGPGTWFGIEFVDGSLGKHNGSYPSLGETYFQGADGRCAMIRSDKIRSKANMKSVPEKKKRYISGRHLRTRTASDLMGLCRDDNDSCYSAAALDVGMAEFASLGFSANFYKKKNFNDGIRGQSGHKAKPVAKHLRALSQPSDISESRSFNSFFGDLAQNKSREERLLGSAIGDEDSSTAAARRKYKLKTPPLRTAKKSKEKYTGNKYILALSKQDEAKRHQRIDGIKRAKKRITKQKHERKSSQLQEIMKEKEKEKALLTRLNEEHKLRDLQRIQLAKQKSRHRLSQSMDARSTQSGRQLMSQLSNISVIFNGAEDEDSDGPVPGGIGILDEEDESDDGDSPNTGTGTTPVLKTSVTPLAEFSEAEFSAAEFSAAEFTAQLSPGLTTPIPSDFRNISSIQSIVSMPIDQVLPFTCTALSVRSYSDSDFGDRRSTLSKYAMEPMVTVKTDSALLLQELMNESIAEASKSRSSSPMQVAAKVRPEAKETAAYATVFSFSDICLGRTDHMHGQHENHEDEKDDEKHDEQDPHEHDADRQSEADESFYFPLSNEKGGKTSQSTQSLPSLSVLSRTESAPLITTDDQGTDYWIKQYNKANKRRSSKKKSKKSTLEKTQAQAVRDAAADVPQSQSQSTVLRKSPPITLPKPRKPIALRISAKHSLSKSSAHTSHASASPNDTFDIQSTFSAFSAFSNVSTASINERYELDSLTVNSGLSSLLSSPVTSTTSTPETDFYSGAVFAVDKSPSPTHTHDIQAARAPKYGTYPLQQNREQYIKQRFTGIVRIGHRYVLRDGRIGVLRFNGCTRFAPGTWIGFELDADQGESDGSVYDVRYFQCAAKYGTFVTKAQIAQYVGRDTTKSLSRAQLKSMSAVQSM